MKASVKGDDIDCYKGCSECTGTGQGDCTACEDGYFYYCDEDKIGGCGCGGCSPHCKSCTKMHCLACMDGYDLNDGKCYEE
jgi:hypothetical protein